MIRPAEGVKSERGDDIMTDKALQLFDQGFNCAQSVFARLRQGLVWMSRVR